jgi:ubiquinone/menaquinone biosynthesis C-methylase UbiE
MKKETLFWDVRARFYWFLEDFIPYRKLIEDVVQKLEIKPNQYILDAGCGIGVLEKSIANKNIPGLKIEAIDFSESMLRRAKSKLKDSQTSLIKFSLVNLNEPLPYQDKLFDAIISINVIYLLPNLSFTLKEFYRVLKREGKLILSTPRPDFNGFKLYFSDIMQKRGFQKIKSLIMLLLYSLCILPFEFIISLREKMGVYHRFTKEKLEKLLLASGFQNIEIGYSYANQNFLVVANK